MHFSSIFDAMIISEKQPLSFILKKSIFLKILFANVGMHKSMDIKRIKTYATKRHANNYNCASKSIRKLCV